MNIRAPARDIAKLKQLYCDIVGLREGWRPPFESRGHWLYAGTEPIVHLVDGEGDAATLASRNCVAHVAFRCTDLAPMIERLRGSGVEFQLTHVPSLGDQQPLFRDPLGIGVELNVSARSC